MTARILVRVALVLATTTWVTWGYLQTVGDHTRGADIARSVLDDPEARHELAAPIASQLRSTADLDQTEVDAVRDAVTTALADPAVRSVVVSAFASAHATALGEAPSDPVDLADVTRAIRTRLDVVAPSLAARIPADADLEVELPALRIPNAAALRSFAERSVGWTGTAAAAAAVAAFVLGSQRRVLFRMGAWAVLTGATTVVATRFWIIGARTFVPSLDATFERAVTTATHPVVDAGWLFVMAGVAAIALSFVFSHSVADVGRRPTAAGGDPEAAAPPRPTRPDRRTPAAERATDPGEPTPDEPTIPGWINGTDVINDPDRPIVRHDRTIGPRVWQVASDGSVESSVAGPDRSVGS